MRLPPRTPATSSGFTLIELMAATAIFLGGMTAVLTAQFTAQSANSMARHWTLGGMLGDNVMDVMSLLPPAKLMSLPSLTQRYDENGTLLQSATAAAFYTVTTQAQAHSVGATGYNAVKVKVQVTWREPSLRQDRVIQLDTEVGL